jgi:hypothetical protein
MLARFYDQFYSSSHLAFDIHIDKLWNANHGNSVLRQVTLSQNQRFDRLIDCPRTNCLNFSPFMLTNNTCNCPSYSSSAGVRFDFDHVHSCLPGWWL